MVFLNCVSSYAGAQETDIYWYHPDHLGSSSFITGLDGEVTQNIEYFPSGEVFVENHLNDKLNTPYKFNGKEQDSETGYYYYGARYYNPRVGLWLNVDPLADYNPIQNVEHYIDGEHNGGVYNSGNNNPYIYCYQSPVRYMDPNGKQVNSSVLLDAHLDRVTGGKTDPSYRMKQSGYQFNAATAHLLSIVSGTNEKNIVNANVTFTHVPFGGGALTDGSTNSGIIHIFWTNPEKGKTANTNTKWFFGFLGLMAHEVGHLLQIDRAGGNYGHRSGSLLQYAHNFFTYGEDTHDGMYSTKEHEADKGEFIFNDFYNFVDKTYGGKEGSNTIEKLFNNKNNSQDVIIKRIDRWWKNYQNSKK